MVRRIMIWAAVAGALGAVFVTAQGCTEEPWDYPDECLYFGGTNCPLDLPCECCQCPWPETCPPFVEPNTIKKIPEWCGPALRDAGCPGHAPYIWTYDLTVCKLGLDGGVEADDAGDGGMIGFCSGGTCVPPAPEAWKHVAFAMTWPASPPACPDEAPIVAFEGTPLPPEFACPKCSCDAPDGKCNLPTKWTIKSVGCDDPSVGVQTNFDPPAAWDGTCSDANAIALDKQCGAVPCVRSITIAPPVIEEQPCKPHAEGQADLPIPKAWNGGPEAPIGRACVSEKPLPECTGQGCTSTNTSFLACIMHDGDQVCPDGWTGAKHVLYGDIKDSRECSPCGCDAPTGGTCQVKWRTFSTATCSVENAALDVYSGVLPACANYMPGAALAGKTAELVDYTKGTCTPNGGELVGKLELANQVTVCCQSSSAM
ncbi:MAG TPA: hypothetical protein PKA58_36090 [Polyangium sp.]|nr:hypothetical protein [Polyangium sp.]